MFFLFVLMIAEQCTKAEFFLFIHEINLNFCVRKASKTAKRKTRLRVSLDLTDTVCL